MPLVLLGCASGPWRRLVSVPLTPPQLAGGTEIAAVRAALPSLKKEKGLRFRDEETGLYLDDEDPEGVYVSSVPPYWQSADLCAALGLPPASTTCAQVQFSLGDL